jgi:hypothetical protein
MMFSDPVVEHSALRIHVERSSTFRKINSNLKTYDENMSIFQLKQLFTLKSPPPLPPETMLVHAGKVDLQRMSPKLNYTMEHCIRGEGDKV